MKKYHQMGQPKYEKELKRKQKSAPNKNQDNPPVENEAWNKEEQFGGIEMQEGAVLPKNKPKENKSSKWEKFLRILFPCRKLKAQVKELSEELELSEARAQKYLKSVDYWKGNSQKLSRDVDYWKESSKYYSKGVNFWREYTQDLYKSVDYGEVHAQGLSKEVDGWRDYAHSLLKQLEETESSARELSGQLEESKSSNRELKEANERFLEQIGELKRENEHIQKWITAKTMLEENDPRAKILLKEIEDFRYAAEAVSGIEVICETIEQYGTYDLLKLRVNQIIKTINVYKEKTGR